MKEYTKKQEDNRTVFYCNDQKLGFTTPCAEDGFKFYACNAKATRWKNVNTEEDAIEFFEKNK